MITYPLFTIASIVRNRHITRLITGEYWHYIIGEERKKLFHWISEIEYRSHHEDLSKDLLPDSGRWLLEDREFIDWSQSNVSSILWLHGIRKVQWRCSNIHNDVCIAGSGKTRLTWVPPKSIKRSSLVISRHETRFLEKIYWRQEIASDQRWSTSC